MSFHYKYTVTISTGPVNQEMIKYENWKVNHIIKKLFLIFFSNVYIQQNQVLLNVSSESHVFVVYESFTGY